MKSLGEEKKNIQFSKKLETKKETLWNSQGRKVSSDGTEQKNKQEQRLAWDGSSQARQPAGPLQLTDLNTNIFLICDLLNSFLCCVFTAVAQVSNIILSSTIPCSPTDLCIYHTDNPPSSGYNKVTTL